MALLLVDLDRVLVMNATGDDCRRGDEIHRTSATALPDTGLPTVIVTHRPRVAARRLLAVAGLARTDGVITASDMLVESLREMACGRYHGLGKVTIARLLRARYGWTDAASTVLVDDRPFNLHAVVRAGIARFGVQVPPVTVAAGRVAHGFDCAGVLAFAAALARGETPPLPSGARWTRMNGDGSLAEGDGSGDGLGFIAEFAATVDWPLSSLGTGTRFSGNGFGLVSSLRMVKGILRR